MCELSDSQSAELHVDLEQLLADLDAGLEQSAEGSKPVDLDQPIGRLSRMDAIQQQKMVQAQRQRLTLRRQQVLAALAAFERDEYGECRSCGAEIPFKRLKVRPEAPFCIECRERMERRS